MKNKWILFLLCACLSITGYAQSIRLFSTNTELSNSLINCVYQDHNGIVWIATEDGLNSYDGSKFTLYRHQDDDNHSLQNNFVETLTEDSKGNLLIGLFNGLQSYDNATDKFETVPLILINGDTINAHVITMLKRKNGDVLIGTSGRGMFQLSENNGKLEARQTQQFAPSEYIRYLFEDSNEQIWVSTDDQALFCITPDKKIKNFFRYKEAISMHISSICQDENGNIYVGSLNKGVYIYDRISDQFIPIQSPNDPEPLPIKTLYANLQGQIYIGTDGKGMRIYDPQSRRITDDNFNVSIFDFKKSKIHSIIEDMAGNTWLGIYQKGVILIPGQTNEFKYLGYKSVLKNVIGSNSVSSIFQDSDDSFWIGTDNDGIYKIGIGGLQIAHFEHSADPHSIPTVVLDIFEDSNHDFWVSSYLNGLAKMDRKTGRCEYQTGLMDKDSNIVQRFRQTIEDAHKNLWIASMGYGLYCMNLNTHKVTHYSAPRVGYSHDLNALHNEWIFCLLISHDEKLYIGTTDGLSCLDLKTQSFISTYGTNALLLGSIIYSIHEDKQNNIWVGTSNGLVSISPNHDIHTYTTKDGLPNNTICSIQEDAAHQLWVSTDYGISRFNPDTKLFTNFYPNNDLIENEFSRNVGMVDKKGQIIFGGISGITYFDPQEINDQKKDITVRITDFYVNDMPIKKGMKSGKHEIIDTAVIYAKEFHLSHKDNSFSIEFSTMDFTNPGRISYIYSLEGDKWTQLPPGINRVSFSNLDAGTYHFKVKANDFNFYSKETEIIIIISPAWYFSTWAKLGYLLLIILAIYLIYMQFQYLNRIEHEKMEHAHTKEIDEAKLQFFINISHEIRTPISLIINPLKRLMATDTDHEREKDYAVMQRNATRILSLINQLMDVRKIDKGQMSLKFRQVELVDFIRKQASIFEEQSKMKDITLAFRPAMEKLDVWIDPQNFDKIILNLLSNAFKYTPEHGRIDILLDTKEDGNTKTGFYELTVSDNGVSIDESEMEKIFERFYQIRNAQKKNEGTGIGLHLTQSLVHLHHGEIHAENNPDGKGCRFIIRLPLGKEHLTAEELDSEKPFVLEETEPAVILQPSSSKNHSEEGTKIKPKSKRNVLVVDDDEEIRNYICHELATDYHTSSCENGKEALSAILKTAPDLIISDVMMPVMDGITLCRKIKQNVNINHIPVILLTAKSKEEDNFEGLDIGADAFIVKPFHIDMLKKTIWNLLRNRDLLKNSFAGNQTQDGKITKVSIVSADEKLLGKVMKTIDKNIANPELSVEMIAEEVGISRVHLHRKLKELTNQTTRDLIRNVRLKQAADLLVNKKISISEVAYSVGFKNLMSFSTAFKESYGMSPSEYVAAHTKSAN